MQIRGHFSPAFLILTIYVSFSSLRKKLSYRIDSRSGPIYFYSLMSSKFKLWNRLNKVKEVHFMNEFISRGIQPTSFLPLLTNLRKKTLPPSKSGIHTIRAQPFYLVREAPNFVYIVVSLIKTPFECVTTYYLWPLDMSKKLFGPPWYLSCAPLILMMHSFTNDHKVSLDDSYIPCLT